MAKVCNPVLSILLAITLLLGITLSLQSARADNCFAALFGSAPKRQALVTYRPERQKGRKSRYLHAAAPLVDHAAARPRSNAATRTASTAPTPAAIPARAGGAAPTATAAPTPTATPTPPVHAGTPDATQQAAIDNTRRNTDELKTLNDNLVQFSTPEEQAQRPPQR
jgi:hypothetical protein